MDTGYYWVGIKNLAIYNKRLGYCQWLWGLVQLAEATQLLSRGSGFKSCSLFIHYVGISSTLCWFGSHFMWACYSTMCGSPIIYGLVIPLDVGPILYLSLRSLLIYVIQGDWLPYCVAQLAKKKDKSTKNLEIYSTWISWFRWLSSCNENAQVVR